MSLRLNMEKLRDLGWIGVEAANPAPFIGVGANAYSALNLIFRTLGPTYLVPIFVLFSGTDLFSAFAMSLRLTRPCMRAVLREEATILVMFSSWAHSSRPIYIISPR